MKRILRLLSIVFLIATIVGSFSGCCDPEEPTSVAIGFAKTRNNADVDYDRIFEHVKGELSVKGSTVTTYEIDGDPHKVGNTTTIDYPIFSSKANKDAETIRAITVAKKNVKNSAPDDVEVNVHFAFRALSEDVKAQGNKKMMIVIISNLLSTSGMIDFKHVSISNENLNKYAEDLSSEMPSFENISVKWFVAPTADAQEDLKISDIEVLKEFYRCLIEKAGGTVEFISAPPAAEESDKSSWPKVSTVNVEKKDFIDVSLDTSTLFKGDSAEFLTRNSTEEILENVAKQVGDEKILVVGSTADTNDSEASHLELSELRAAAIKERLITLGVPPENIETIGIGNKSHKYRAKNEEENRCVYILSRSSEKAKYFSLL